MPLKCLDENGEAIFSIDFGREAFEALRVEQRARRHLRFPCCDGIVGLRVSRSGLPHFYHQSGLGGCYNAEETELHLRIKNEVVLAARDAGWSADTEVVGGIENVSMWKADVLAIHGGARVAFEAQLSPQTWADTCQRQERYREAGVRGLWLFRKARYDVTDRVPAFQIRDEEGVLEVRVTPPAQKYSSSVAPHVGHWVPLRDFVIGALGKQLHWAPVTKLGTVDVRLRVKNPVICSCGEPVLLPVSFSVTAPFAGLRPLLWTVATRPFRKDAPAWLNAAVAYINEHCPEAEKVATRERADRYTFRYRCPHCNGELADVLTPHAERTFLRAGVPLDAIPRPRPDTAEWSFVYQWWLGPALWA
ncbi:hypothetical protein F6X40_09500 [Paraburkholderia sp. UCT31]|uniref:competence protein CoiA family protein n=1 Tax=Paraburkholderia sp. UCT31 TaxID=2615209 RepID=UPI0016566868|nr:hypothetical protein [Paraburkholderia sp. UCT31]MBC8737043.1 hypothetical protein [Paraburkholderia sp. UCT31]